jgi:hypothetical protein
MRTKWTTKGNSAQLCQNFGISRGWGGLNHPKPPSVRHWHWLVYYTFNDAYSTCKVGPYTLSHSIQFEEFIYRQMHMLDAGWWGKSKRSSCPAETCFVMRILMSFNRLYISWRDMSRAHWNAGMQFGGHNYFLSWSGQRRSMEALWGRGLEACAMHWQVCVLKIVINTAVLHMDRFIDDRQVQCTRH